MTTAVSRVEERQPVWSALSEFFLDTELDEADHARIARVLASSPYSEEKLEEILRFEVTPALKANLLCVAGEWTSFDESWLREKISPRIDKRPLFNFGVFWLVRVHWKDVMRRVAIERAK